MNEIKRPKDTNTHLEQIDEIVEYLFEHCDPEDKTDIQKTRRVSARLENLICLFKKDDNTDAVKVSVYGFIQRLIAKQNGHLDRTPDKKKTDSGFSNYAKSIIDWLSDASDDNLPSDKLRNEALESLRDPSLINSTKRALNEIFETVGGQVRLKEKAMLAIRAGIVEKTGEAIPQESRKAVETALSSSRPFDDTNMKVGLLQDGGDVYKRHPDGGMGMDAKAMQHMLAEILFNGPRGKEGYADGADQNRDEAQDLG